VGIAKGAAAVTELRDLLQHWQPGESAADLLARTQQADVLGKQTAYRTRDMVRRVFRPRLLMPDDRAARALKVWVEQGGDQQTFRELIFLYEARADDLVYDFTVRQFWPACRSGQLTLSVNEVLAFFDEAARDGRLPKPWSPQVQVKVARGVLGALREFGFLREDKNHRREIVLYRLTDAGLAYLVHDLHFAGLADATLVEHPDWGLFGLDRRHLLERLDALDERAGLIVQRAGDVVRLSWSHASMESLLYAFTRG
jgi:hypothetical protein